MHDRAYDSPVRAMKDEYDFRGGKRGPVVRVPSGKTRITIRIDDESLEWFRDQVRRAGGGSYQTLINDAIREFISSREHKLEDTFRRVLREELPRYSVGRKTVRKRR